MSDGPGSSLSRFPPLDWHDPKYAAIKFWHKKNWNRVSSASKEISKLSADSKNLCFSWLKQLDGQPLESC
jgi:hypothetical protein